MLHAWSMSGTYELPVLKLFSIHVGTTSPVCVLSVPDSGSGVCTCNCGGCIYTCEYIVSGSSSRFLWLLISIEYFR